MVGSIKFASKKEANRYRELLLLERAGEIADLELQPKFDLWAATSGMLGREKVATYLGDFQYRDLRQGGVTVVEDVKGFKTPVYRLKKRLMAACHRIQIKEV